MRVGVDDASDDDDGIGVDRARVVIAETPVGSPRGADDESRHLSSADDNTNDDDDAMAHDAGAEDEAEMKRSASDASYASARDVPFRVLCKTFEMIQRAKTGASRKETRAKRYRALDWFHDGYLQGKRDGGCRADAFEAYRLLIPSLDKERGVYGMKHDALAKTVIAAFDMSRASKDAVKLEEWKKNGGGNFAMAVYEVLNAGHLAGRAPDEDVVTIGEVNDALDALTACGNREERARVLRKVFNKMDATQVKWICAIILKETKLHMGDKLILRHYHRDAEMLWDWTSNLRRVCEDLPSREMRLKHTDIEVGQGLINPQLAQRKNTVDAVYKALKGKQFVIETKFDGERIQVHRNGDVVQYWTRNMNDFGPRGYDVLDGLFRQGPKRCILDGELMVWNKLRQEWYPFGALKTLIQGANQRKAKDELFPLNTRERAGGKEDDEDNADNEAGLQGSKYAWYAENVKKITYGDLELVYVPFDILYVDDGSVRHLKLSERHELLRERIKETSVMCGNIKAKILLALPDSEFARVGSTKEDIESDLLRAMDNGEEGLVIKDLDGPWIAGDRSTNWMKIKPDYLKTEDLDVLLIGGYYGAGALRGGKISQFLVGIMESPPDFASSAGTPPQIMSFCKVGTGMSMSELEDVRNHLADYMHLEPPPNYNVTGAYGEKPDVWIWPPERSIVVRVKGDIRMIPTTTFATGYSLRFPRITGLRYDKKWSDILTFAQLKHTIDEDRVKFNVDVNDPRPGLHARHKRARTTAQSTLLPAHLMPVDVSGIMRESEIFKNMQVHVVNAHSREQKQELFKQVIARGGATSEFWHDKVTHCVAAKREGEKFVAACLKGDVYTIAWLEQCISEGRIVPPRPRHRLHLATSTWYSSDGKIDRYGDEYLTKCNEEDVLALLEQVGDQSARWHGVEIPAMATLTKEYPELFAHTKYLTFRECVFTIDETHRVDGAARSVLFPAVLECERKNAESLVRLHGGTIAPANRTGTHILRPYDREYYKFVENRHTVVSFGWVEKCIEAKETL